jgi:Protein of unknown function (DUF2946)
MDTLVLAAMRKWPDVPDCYGWLGLDARGNWWMRDDAVQASGHFAQAKGERIAHRALLEFITRNYAADARGCWYFQNGPQRVFVELEAAPWVWRLHASAEAAPAVCSHTGIPTSAQATYLDAHDRLYLATPLGLGLVHTMDMHLAADAVEAGGWAPQPSSAEALAAQFGYCLSPARHRITP